MALIASNQKDKKASVASANQYNMYRQSQSAYFQHFNSGSDRRNSSLGVTAPPPVPIDYEGGSSSGQTTIQKNRNVAGKKKTNPLMSQLGAAQ
jgi:hypothetical protein